MRVRVVLPCYCSVAQFVDTFTFSYSSESLIKPQDTDQLTNTTRIATYYNYIYKYMIA